MQELRAGLPATPRADTVASAVRRAAMPGPAVAYGTQRADVPFEAARLVSPQRWHPFHCTR